MLTLILALLLAWLAYAVWFRRAQDRILFRPDRRPLALADAGLGDFQPVWTQTADGLSLEGWRRPADGFTKPTILLLPGQHGHPALWAASRARLLADAGFGVLLAGLRGQAGNPGTPTEAGLLTDARAWADFLVRQGVSGGRLALYGEETGAFLAATLASERSAARLVLEAPFPAMADLLERRFPLLPLRSLLRHRFDLTPVLPLVQAPVLILHAGADREVPAALGARLDRLVTAPLRCFRPAGVAAADLLRRGGDEALLSFLDDGGISVLPSPTLDQTRPPGGRAVTVRS